jgi:serine/threonine-protein kinase
VYDRSKDPIGSGAMGTVYYGFMCGTNVPVAIKKVKDEFANEPGIRNRACLEASLMFRHRNLVEMLGLCEWQQGSGPIFIVSKFVRGENLDKFVKQKLSGIPQHRRIKTICDMVLPIFDALHYLHSSNILHMDIKPSNIMVENGCNIRLMDLGIANVDAYETASRSMMGTPKYAAPEQFGEKGSLETIDSRTDIYELGVTIYELLCDENPFYSNDFNELIEKHKTLSLPYNKIVPPAIIEVLRKAAHPNKSFRYANILEFRNAFKNSLVTITSKPAQSSSPGKFVKIFLAILCIVLIATILISLFIIL